MVAPKKLVDFLDFAHLDSSFDFVPCWLEFVLKSCQLEVVDVNYQE